MLRTLDCKYFFLEVKIKKFGYGLAMPNETILDLQYSMKYWCYQKHQPSGKNIV